MRGAGHGPKPSGVLTILAQPRAAFWPELLRYNSLADFDALWRLQIPWYEPPNYGRAVLSGKRSRQHATPLAEVKTYFAECGFEFVADFSQMPLVHTLHLAVFRRSLR